MSIDIFIKGGKWESVHVDELRPSSVNLPSLNIIRNKTVSQLFQASVRSKEADWKPLNLGISGNIED